MGSTSPIALPALKTNPKFIFFTDFDGTITQQDSNDFITDNLGFGPALRKKGNEDTLFGRRHFRDTFEEMMDSINVPYDQCIAALLQNITLDEGFKEFFVWARENNVPIVVLSGGMEPIIRALLTHLLGKEDAATLQIVSNNVAPRPGKSINEAGGWKIVFHDDSGFGHDKSLEIRPYATLPEEKRPILFYAGDGVSDLSAAKETDLLFAKAGRDLVTYCEKEDVPFTTFNDFSDILSTVKLIVSGKLSVKEAATGRSGAVHARANDTTNSVP
ncbi:Pdp3-interacting factor 1 [Echria macrotheca]|uniref:Pdp3-interacting factor 1 n=1 Tax=Echria macrotheca TaxID=438768 RepID=A0AAJ0BE17_9PEZI|nr:Pdp3-interacting factor 1 [Echria macrotheca]